MVTKRECVFIRLIRTSCTWLLLDRYAYNETHAFRSNRTSTFFHPLHMHLKPFITPTDLNITSIILCFHTCIRACMCVCVSQYLFMISCGIRSVVLTPIEPNYFISTINIIFYFLFIFWSLISLFKTCCVVVLLLRW